MKASKMNDLAFNFIENEYEVTAEEIKRYFLKNGGKKEELNYFLTFVKLWLDNKRSLEWNDIYLELV